jgi:putative ABC transport system ATP-binding protein
MTSVIRTNVLTKVYQTGRTQVRALRGVNLLVEPGEMIAVMGPSGSGKSTLMNILGCLDRPTSGQYWLEGRDLPVSADERAVLQPQDVVRVPEFQPAGPVCAVET